MTNAQINALLASAYNRHVAKAGDAMTPAKAAKLPRGDRAALCRIGEDKGLDLYTAEQCRQAFAVVVS